MIETTKRLCTSILLLLVHSLVHPQTGYPLFTIAEKSSSVNDVTPPNAALKPAVDNTNATSVSELTLIDCPDRWTCKNYDHRKVNKSQRGHYRDVNCACDEMCVLLEDCCPDAHEFWPSGGSSDPTAGQGAWSAAGRSTAESSNRSSVLEKVSASRTKVFRRPRPLNKSAGKLGAESKSREIPRGDAESVLRPGRDGSSKSRKASRSGAASGPRPNTRARGKGGSRCNRASLSSSSDCLTTSSPPPTTPSPSTKKEKLRGLSGNMRDVYARYSLAKDVFSCVYDKGINMFNKVSVVTRCPRVYDEDLEVLDLCHNVSNDDMMTRLPVSGTASKVLYRNMFCALCHQEPFVYWTAGVNCSSRTQLPYTENTTLSDVQLNSTDCRVRFRPPVDLYGWRPCLADVERSCSDSFPLNTTLNKQIAERCEASKDRTIQRTVFAMTRTYWNQFCGLCNHNQIEYLSCQPLTWDTSMIQSVRGHTQLYSFSILLDINTNTGSTTVGRTNKLHVVERNETVSCGQGQVFDPFRSVCRPVTCGTGRHFVGNACEKKAVTTIIPHIHTKLFSHHASLVNMTSKDALFHAMLNCTSIQLNDTEFQLFNNGTLNLLGTDLMFDESQFAVINGNVFLCVNYSQNYTRTVTSEVESSTFTFSLIEAVVSTCGICISLLALAITIFVYASVRHLQNIPGQNLLSLVTSLFLADALLLLAPTVGGGDTFLACAVIGGLMHYLFLASFVWMNVMALDVWFTFSRAFVKAGDRGKSSKRFLFYSGYAWLTPAAFVLPAVLLQVLKPDSSLSPNYGLGICWVSNKSALFLFFAGPLSFLLLLNVVFFIISARNISLASRSSARMLGKEEDSKMGIYVKLTVIMGITWILGFLAALVPGNKILTYSFVVMNTLQGLFICVSFVFTKKVFRLLKDKFGVGFRAKFRVTKSGSTHLTNVSSSSRKLSSCSAKFSNNVVV